jgi:hypothetical protein
VQLESARQEVTFETRERPRTLTIDPALHVFRRLDEREIPPIVRQVTLDSSSVTVVATKTAEIEPIAHGLAERLMDTTPRFGDDPPRDAAVIVIGLHADVDAWLARANLPPEPEQLRTRGSAQVWTARYRTARRCWRSPRAMPLRCKRCCARCRTMAGRAGWCSKGLRRSIGGCGK